MRFGTKTIAALGILAAAAFASSAQAQMKPEESLKMRQGLMQTVKFNFGALGAFAQGKADLPADAAKRADNLVALAKMVPAAWGKGTDALEGANTKAEAFTSADFVKGWEAMGVAAEKLSVAARSGNADAVKAAAGEVGKTCKGCHDTFRKE